MVFVIHLLPSRSTTVTTVCRNDPEALYLSAIDPLLRFGDRRLVVCSTCFRTRMSYGEETKKENFPIEIRCRERVPCRRHLLRPTTLRAYPSLQALLCLYLRVTEASAKTQYGPCGAGLDAADEEEEKTRRKLSVSLPASGSRPRPREVLSASVTLHSLVPDLRLTYLILRSVLPVYQSQTSQTLIRLLSH